MKKRSPQHHFRAWAVCVVALSSAMGWAQDAARVYIQGSEVNLRDNPTTSAEVVKKVTIGTECQCLEELAKGWVRLKCGDAEGFTLKMLVGADKPSLDKLLAQAQDTTASTKVRFDAAARAATLDPQHEQAPDLLAELFFELNFEQLAKDKVKSGLHEAVVVTRRWDHSQNRQRSREESLIWELEKIEYDWHQFKLRGGDFVSAMYRNGSLVVYTGYISPKAGDEEFNVILESRSSSAVADALKLALQEDARPADTSEKKYAVIEEEYPGMPVLSPESFRLYRALPALWYLLQGEKGARYVQSSCDIITGIQLRVDIHRRASLRFGNINGSGEAPPKSMRVVEVSKSDSSYHFQLRDRREYQESLTLTWPTDEPNVSQWKTEPSSAEDGYYAVAKARNIKIKDFGCSAEQ